MAHALSAVREALGEIGHVSAELATRRGTALVVASGETLPVSAPDQVLVSAMMASGTPLSIHYRSGMTRVGHGFIWEINGTHGDLRHRKRGPERETRGDTANYVTLKKSCFSHITPIIARGYAGVHALPE